MDGIKQANISAEFPAPDLPAISPRFLRAQGEAHPRLDSDGPLTALDPEAIDGLRAVLDEAGFHEKGVREALSDQSQRLELKRIDFPLYEQRLAAPGALNTFIKLFMMQLWQEPSRVEQAVKPLTLDRLIALGLLRRGPHGVRSTCALALCDGLIVAHDRVAQECEEPQADHVLGVNPSAAALANLTVRRRAERTLDIGTGSGIQALLASRHSAHVVATDTNPRALNYLMFNVRLNRVENLECRRGSLFEPVAGSRFDLITCNPPYVISPESHLIFRDSGLPGDLICERLVRQIPAHLAPGGYACVLCNWVHKKEQDWFEPIREWVENSGCDAWVLRGSTEDPLSYAAPWTRSQQTGVYSEALERWRDYYARSGIEALSMGAVILRRRADNAPGWFRSDDWPAKPAESCSDHILRVFQAEDYLQATPDTALVQQTFSLVDEHCIRQEMKFHDGDLSCKTRRLELERGLRFQCNLDVHSMTLLSQCDGKLTLAQGIKALSRSTGAPPEQLSNRATEVVRKLIALGFLVPISTGQAPTPSRRTAGPGIGIDSGQGAAMS